MKTTKLLCLAASSIAVASQESNLVQSQNTELQKLQLSTLSNGKSPVDIIMDDTLAEFNKNKAQF